MTRVSPVGKETEVNKITDGIKEYMEKSCSLDARLQITKKRFQLQTSRKAGLRKTTNEMV
jgi:hypothetical protein